MKKFLFLLGLLATCPLIGRAQVPVYQNVIFVGSAPSGACTNGSPMQVVISTGVLYSCQASTWAIVGGGGGGGPYVPLAGGVPMTGATGGNPIAGGINATQLEVNGTALAPFPSGTQGEPLINTSGGVAYTTSGLFYDASQYTGATVDLQANACNTASMTSSIGCDLRNLGVPLNGTTPINSQVNIGDSSQNPALALLPQSGLWVASMTDGTSCGMKLWDRGSIIGTNPGGESEFGVQAGSGSNLGYLFCTDPVLESGGQSYFYVSGMETVTHGIATANNVGDHFTMSYDNSVIDRFTAFDSGNATAVLVDNMCCADLFKSFNAQSNGSFGKTPLHVDNPLGLSIKLQAVSFEDFSIDHPGQLSGSTCEPAIYITDEGGNISNTNWVDGYTETSSTCTQGALMQIVGARATNVENWTVHSQVANNLSPAISVSNAFNTGLLALGINCVPGAGSWASGQCTIVDNYLGHTYTSDANGNFGVVATAPSYFESLILPALGTSTSPVCPNGVNGALTTSGCGGSGGNATSIQGTAVSATPPTTNQVLQYNGSDWAPATLSGSGGFYGNYAGTATGSVNAMVATLTPAPGSLSAMLGIPVGVLPNLTNTATTPTVNFNSFGAETIVKCGSTPLVAGDLATNTPAILIWNGTNMQLQNPLVGLCQTSGGALTLTGNFTGTNVTATTMFSGNYRASSQTASAVYQGGQDASNTGTLGSLTARGADNFGGGTGGSATLQAGYSATQATGTQGFANIQQAFTVASSLSATFEAVAMTTTADQIQAAPLGGFVNVGIAQSTGSGALVSGTYTSGITATGSTGQTCTLNSFNNSATGAATVALTGANTIAGGTALVITSPGGGATAAPTSATAANGTATCSGTATVSTAILTDVFVVSNGKTTVRFDGTPVVGDLACYPPATGTVGLAHDNGTTACPSGQQLGNITGQVSGTGSGATATVLLGLAPLINLTTYATLNPGTATIAVAAGAGSGATATCVTTCNAQRGRVSVVAGTLPVAGTSIFTVTFGTAYANTNYVCSVTMNGGATFLIPSWAPTSATVMTVSTTVAVAATTEFDYLCTP